MSAGPASGSEAVGRQLGVTPSQTAGPFLHLGMVWPDGPTVVDEDAPGAVWIGGRIIDGAGAPVADGIVETWQADSHGRFASAEDPRVRTSAGEAAGFRGWGRCTTDDEGRWRIRTVKPGPVPGPNGTIQAPHIDLTIHARGLLRQLFTRIYFADEPDANSADPVLSGLPDDAARNSLLATHAESGYTADIVLQGDHATVFFDV
jgi:protocatechuate 3,4-dioxygenase alpha subunit